MAVIQTHVSDELKSDAERIFAAMGMTVAEGVRIFLHSTISARALPFKPRVHDEPNDELKAAMRDAIEGKNMVKIGTSEDLRRLYESLE